MQKFTTKAGKLPLLPVVKSLRVATARIGMTIYDEYQKIVNDEKYIAVNRRCAVLLCTSTR